MDRVDCVGVRGRRGPDIDRHLRVRGGRAPRAPTSRRPDPTTTSPRSRRARATRPYIQKTRSDDDQSTFAEGARRAPLHPEDPIRRRPVHVRGGRAPRAPTSRRPDPTTTSPRSRRARAARPYIQKTRSDDDQSTFAEGARHAPLHPEDPIRRRPVHVRGGRAPRAPTSRRPDPTTTGPRSRRARATRPYLQRTRSDDDQSTFAEGARHAPLHPEDPIRRRPVHVRGGRAPRAPTSRRPDPTTTSPRSRRARATRPYIQKTRSDDDQSTFAEGARHAPRGTPRRSPRAHVVSERGRCM